MAEVFLCERGQLTSASKSHLRKAGIVVVEVEDPSKCQFIRSSEIISGDDMLWAVFDAFNAKTDYSSNLSFTQKERLSQNLLSLVNQARTARIGS